MSTEEVELVITEALNNPEEMRVEFLVAKQKESNLSPSRYIQELNIGVHKWNRMINEAFEKDSGSISIDKHKITLLSKANSKLKRHINKQDILYLGKLIRTVENELMPEGMMYSITNYLSSLQDNKEFKHSQKQIKTRGFINAISKEACYKVFTAELVMVLFENNLQVKDLENGSMITINGLKWLDTYTMAYEEGKTYFLNNYSINPKDLYGDSKISYLRNLHFQYCHAEIDRELNKGWKFVKEDVPHFISTNEIKKFGFYSGVLHELIEIQKAHPRLFDDIEKCDHELSQTQNSPFNNFELAMRQYYLEEFKIEPVLIGKQIVEKYGKKQVEVFLNDFRNKRVDPNRRNYKQNLAKVAESLSDYPEVQKAVLYALNQL